MKKITGVHSVDFKIEGSGHGCVNWNGSVSLKGDSGTEVKNHSVPKMRGWSNKTGKVKDESGYEYKVGVHDIDTKNNPMYISQNCMKHHIFKEEMPFHLGKLSEAHAKIFLRSPVGLLRGYAITSQTPLMKKSPVLMEDAYDDRGECNFEYLSTSTSKQNSETGGFYSKTTVGDTHYTCYGSVNIEELQFISCDGIFGRSAIGIGINENDVKQMAQDISARLKQEAEDLGVLNVNPIAEYDSCWVRHGSLMNIGEAGILLNNDAILVLIKYFENLLSGLYIHQARGWMKVDNVLLDFNDGKHFRIKENAILAKNSYDGLSFARYYVKGNDNQRAESKKEQALLLSHSSTRKSKKATK